jgi:[ribosomal protein S5]-alanine N-acetyltransferase
MQRDPFAQFPYIESDTLVLRKIEPSDLDALAEIYMNETLFRFTPGSPRKTREAVRNIIGHFERDFGKRKTIILGICLKSDPGHIVGVGEMFDYNRKVNMITIGYRLHEDFWGRGIATQAVELMTGYLFCEIGLNRIQAFVMPENKRSHPVLERNGFIKEGTIRQGYVWTGRGVVDLTIYSLLRSDPHA